MPGLRPWILLLCVALLSGCAEQTDPGSERRVAVAPAAEEEEPLPEWLTVNDPTPPEQWLAAQRLNPDPASKARIAELLKQGSQHYQESPRMLANRAYQLQQMLGEAGMAEDAVDLLERLMTLPDYPYLRGFSANCQHYFNLRQQGLPPDQALERLITESSPTVVN